MPILQVISTSPYDSLQIQKSGADRIQLVSALQIGGLTPSSIIIRKSLECVNIPTMVMIRHHNNGFIHTQEQIQLFCDQIVYCKELGVKGIVFGGNNSKNEVDINLIHKIKKQIQSNKIDVTFHKAFDQTKNIVQSYDKLNTLKINRILTQGGTENILKNIQNLSKIIKKSKQNDNNTKVLLGGGINFDNIQQIIKTLAPQQIHIGTCVRKNKYGPVQANKIQEFIQKMKI